MKDNGIVERSREGREGGIGCFHSLAALWLTGPQHDLSDSRVLWNGLFQRVAFVWPQNEGGCHSDGPTHEVKVIFSQRHDAHRCKSSQHRDVTQGSSVQPEMMHEILIHAAPVRSRPQFYGRPNKQRPWRCFMLSFTGSHSGPAKVLHHSIAQMHHPSFDPAARDLSFFGVGATCLNAPTNGLLDNGFSNITMESHSSASQKIFWSQRPPVNGMDSGRGSPRDKIWAVSCRNSQGIGYKQSFKPSIASTARIRSTPCDTSSGNVSLRVSPRRGEHILFRYWRPVGQLLLEKHSHQAHMIVFLCESPRGITCTTP